MKTYSKASQDVLDHIERMKQAHHEADLGEATVDALFVFDDEDSHSQVLTHNGYPAAAMVKITGLKDRALGIADAVIIIDRAYWSACTAAQRDALMDHELQHLERAFDEETGDGKSDPLGRPLLRSRKHDYQMGWFAAVAERHGQDSPEVRQAKALIADTKQLFFDFPPPAPPPAPPPRSRASRQATAH
jgi:hypothetical protein